MKTVEEVRRERLAELKAEFGSFAAINAKIDRLPTDSTLSQISNASVGSKTGKPKTMGSDQARLLEEKLQKPRGWMDTDPDLLKGTSFSPPNIALALAVVLDSMVKSTAKEELKQLLAMLLDTNAAAYRTRLAELLAQSGMSPIPGPESKDFLPPVPPPIFDKTKQPS